jgi:hypothetical protein
MRHYVYYSYEEWGRGYIGVKSSEDPVTDGYFGSYVDPTFQPTNKIIIAEFPTREQAVEAEVALHRYFEVADNPHFANKANQPSPDFGRIDTCALGGHTQGQVNVKTGHMSRIQQLGAPKGGMSQGKNNIESGHIQSLGKRQGKINVESGLLRKAQNKQFVCTKTGFIGNAGNVARHQKRLGIDSSHRKPLDQC